MASSVEQEDRPFDFLTMKAGGRSCHTHNGHASAADHGRRVRDVAGRALDGAAALQQPLPDVMIKVVATGAQNAHAELNLNSKEIGLRSKFPVCFPAPLTGKHVHWI